MDREREEGPAGRGIAGQGIKKCLRHFMKSLRFFMNPCPSDDGLSHKVKKPRRNGGRNGNEMQNQKKAVCSTFSGMPFGGGMPPGSAAPDGSPGEGAH